MTAEDMKVRDKTNKPRMSTHITARKMVRTGQAVSVKFIFPEVGYLTTLTQKMHHRSIFNVTPVKVVHFFKTRIQFSFWQTCSVLLYIQLTSGKFYHELNGAESFLRRWPSLVYLTKFSPL